jgi:hypothetical protein
VYYAQAIMYMHAAGLRKHWLTCSSPGERFSIAVTTHADPDYAESLLQKAQLILEHLGWL